MARPLRMEVPGGRYHITARGNEQRNLFRSEEDHYRFLELLSVLPERFGVRVHAYVLMPNHYHLLLETPEGNLSQAVQWMNVSYSVWFNRRHQRSGHLFQGRFKSIIIEDDAGFQELGRYLHLNPVRVRAVGLDKAAKRSDRMGLSEPASRKILLKRLQMLREWKWSSYRAYAGYSGAPSWLTIEPLGSWCGGRTRKQRQAALRAYTEQAIRQGMAEQPWERLIGGAVLGSTAFARRLSQLHQGSGREVSGIKEVTARVGWNEILRALEQEKGERWGKFMNRHGDWGRDGALWLGRHFGRFTLRELGKRAGGLDYATVGQAVSRFGRRLAQERSLARSIQRIQQRLSKVKV